MESKLAIWSFVLSLIGIVNYFSFYFMFSTPIFSVPSIILGIVGLRKIKKYNLEGKGIAVAGIIISSLIMIFYAWFIYSFWGMDF